MDNDRIIRKIKRCLALSKSCNVNEAATALRQAQALMQKHGVTTSDVDASSISGQEVTATATKTAPSYITNLAAVIAQAFGCRTLIKTAQNPYTGKWISRMEFIGFDQQPKIAAYAFSVLRRQIIQDRQRFAKRLSNMFSQSEKTAAADNYALGWVYAAKQHVIIFATPPEQEDAIRKYMNRQHGELDGTTGRAPKDAGAIAGIATKIGFSDGQKVRLYHGMDDSDKPALLSDGASL